MRESVPLCLKSYVPSALCLVVGGINSGGGGRYFGPLNSGLWGLWEVWVPGRYFSPSRGLMDHCDGGLWEVAIPGIFFSP